MSFFTTISDDFTAFKIWWTGTTIGKEIDAAAEAAKAEIEAVAPADLEQIAASTATAIIPGLATGNYAAAIAAGIATAETGFKAASATVSSDTLGTFATTLAKNITVPAAAAPATPAS